MAWCNAYGAENPGGVGTPFGGFLPNSVAVQPVCKNPAAHRFTWKCACGHHGQPVSLCEQHHAEFNGLTSYRSNVTGHVEEVPWNIRRDVQACPRCASMAESPEQQHKCKLELVTVS